MSLQAVKQEIADRCNTIAGLRCYAFAPPSPQVPAMGVRLARSSYNATEDGDWTTVLDVLLYVNPNDLARAQESLDKYLSVGGSASVPSVLQSVEVTPGVIESLRVIGVPGPYFFTSDQVSGNQTLAAILEVECILSGN